MLSTTDYSEKHEKGVFLLIVSKVREFVGHISRKQSKAEARKKSSLGLSQIYLTYKEEDHTGKEPKRMRLRGLWYPVLQQEVISNAEKTLTFH